MGGTKRADYMATRLSYDEKQEQIQSLYTDAKASKTRIARFEKTASKKTGAIESLLAKGTEKFTNSLSGFEAKLKSEASNFLKKAKTELETVSGIEKEAKREYTSFSRVYGAAMNKASGVEAKHTKIVQFADTASEKVKQISKDEKRSAKASASISELLTNSRAKAKVVTEVHDEAVAISEEIRNTYELTLDTSMAGTFVERREALKRRTRNWEQAYLGSIGFIVVGIFTALLINPPDNFIEAVTERLVFVTPLVVIAFVLSKQYGHERKLYEEYAFKAAAAQSLRGYTILLNSQFKENEGATEHILKFTIDAMNSIYDWEPLAQTPTITHLIFGNDLAKFEAKIEDKIEKAAKSAVRAATESVN